MFVSACRARIPLIGCLIGGGSSEMGSHRFSMSSSGIIFELGVLYLGGDE